VWQFVVTPQFDGSHTGRYVLLTAVSPSGYPSGEDYILLVRRPGELFRPACMIYVPFDEEPPALLDYAAQPEVAVIFQDFTLAWTDDGGRTIRTPAREPKDLFDLWRFGTHRIERVETQGDYLYVRMAAGRHPVPGGMRDAFIGDAGRMWRLRIDGSSSVAELVEPPSFVSEPAAEGDVLVQGGSRLLMRASIQSPWVEVPPDTLMEQLQEAKISFFGGVGARYIERAK
jgi:hypothetical protein